MWKKVAMVAAITAGLMSVSYAQDIRVIVDGDTLQFADQKPVIQDGRTLVPLRSVFEAIGASVDWNATTRTITAKKRFDVVNLEIDSKDLYKNGVKVTEMTLPAQILNGRTMVPARYVAEAFNGAVKWDSAEQLVTVETLQHTHQINDVYGVESIKNEEGTKSAVNIKYSYPIIKNENQNIEIDTINKALKEYAENWLANVKKEIEEYSLVELSKTNEGETYEYELAFDITADEEKVLSVIYRTNANIGGAHPTSLKDTMVFSFETGEKMGVEEIFNMSEEKVMYSIQRFFESVIEETPSKFYENAKKLLPEVMKNVKYYVLEDRVIFFLNPYEIAPYAAGEIEIIIDRP